MPPVSRATAAEQGALRKVSYLKILLMASFSPVMAILRQRQTIRLSSKSLAFIASVYQLRPSVTFAISARQVYIISWTIQSGIGVKL